MFSASATNAGNPFIGMYACSNNSITLAPRYLQPKFEDALKVLGTKVIRTSVFDSDLLGIFCVMNENGIALSELVSSSELKQIKSQASDLNVTIIRGRFTALGNNVAANSHGAIANPEFSTGEIKKISDALGVEVVQLEVAKHKTVGSAVIATEKGFMAHNDVEDDELKKLEKIFKVDGGIGTCNMGVSYPRISLIANSEGFIYGANTSGFETSRIVEALGFLE
ncbi:Translation initiation factor 6 [Candidatus Gugararchaeum adminiculabundum]|nr:Translation initiation factor 6 [Candidatus Gugararchaeum adminiculabundum]